MANNGHPVLEAKYGQWSVMHLLAVTAFFEPIIAVAIDLKSLGGGALRYLVGALAAVAIGAFIVWADSILGRTMWGLSRAHSKQAQNVIAAFYLVTQLGWIVAGAFCGSTLAQFIAKHILQ